MGIGSKRIWKIVAKWENHARNPEKAINEKKEIQELYKNFDLSGIIVDVVGSVGTLREFINSKSKFVSIDPHSDPLQTISNEKIQLYPCLKKPLNYIRACAEFLPLKSCSVDILHMRSMLDHVQIPDLAIKEACRVLKDSGKLLIGIHLPMGKNNNSRVSHFLKESLRNLLTLIGFKRFADHHTWHPSYDGLIKIVTDNGFKVKKEVWQPSHNEKVINLLAEIK